MKSSPLIESNEIDSVKVGCQNRRRSFWAVTVALATLAGATTGLWMTAVRSHKIAYLEANGPANWIVYPTPANTFGHLPVTLDAIFRRDFNLSSASGPVKARLRAFRGAKVFINGLPVFDSLARGHWKEEQTADIAHLIRVGGNRIDVVVTNDNGPPALWFELNSPEVRLLTDRDWDVSRAGAIWVKAALATDPMPGRQFDANRHVNSTYIAFIENWFSVLAFAALVTIVVGGGFWLLGQRGELASRLMSSPWLVAFAWVVVALCWIVMFANNGKYLPLSTGYDVAGL